MEKPHIICHMVESVDGRIDCGMVDKISGDEYYTTLESLGCTASVEGRITMEHYYALPGRFVAADTTPAGSVHIERMAQNLDIFDFSLSEDDMQAIAALDTGKSLFFDHHDPEVVKMFMGWR